MTNQNEIGGILEAGNTDYSHIIEPDETQRLLLGLKQQKHYSRTFKNLLNQVDDLINNNGTKHEPLMLALDFLYHAGCREIFSYADNELWPASKEECLIKYADKEYSNTKSPFLELARNFLWRRSGDWATPWMEEELTAVGMSRCLHFTSVSEPYFQYEIGEMVNRGEYIYKIVGVMAYQGWGALTTQYLLEFDNDFLKRDWVILPGKK